MLIGENGMKNRDVPTKQSNGFTIVELLIVIVVIAVLAAVTLIAMNGLKERAENSKVAADISTLSKAILAARNNEQKTVNIITGNLAYGQGGTGAACSTLPAGTDLAVLAKTSNCWVSYNNALDKISTASGINVRGIVDPLGRPYAIYEGESSLVCIARDEMWAFGRNYAPWGARWPGGAQTILPQSGFVSGC